MTLRQIMFCMVLVAAATGYAFPIQQPEETQLAPAVWPEDEDLVFTYFKRQAQPKPPPQLDPASAKTKDGEVWQPLRVNEKPKTADPLQRVRQSDVDEYIN